MIARLAAFAALLTAPVCAAASPPGETAFAFKPTLGEPVDAYRGVISVPENRATRGGKRIDIHYVRFPATGDAKGTPLVYLAGGPGGSGVDAAKGERFPLFMALREFGDVIALDQRGTGLSETAPLCTSDVVIPVDRVVADAEYASMLRQAAEQCGRFWRESGHDPKGYTTVESARDLEDLRRHLGARKLSLWGISYGTHLALAAVRTMGPRLDRLILTGVEGLDQTVKLPSETDAYFGRLQQAIDREPGAKAAYPDVAALIRRVHARLDAEPVRLSVKGPQGETPFLLTRSVMQRIASASIADPAGAARLLPLYLAVDAGYYAPVAALIGRLATPGAPERFRLMPLAMDVASGVSPARRARVEREAATSLLGLALNDPMPQLAGALDLDLGEDFRRPPRAATPTLVLIGTLDGRTYPAEQAAAVAGLRNTTIVTVEGAGHNLFMTTPAVTETIRTFLRGGTLPERRISAPAPSFAPPSP